MKAKAILDHMLDAPDGEPMRTLSLGEIFEVLGVEATEAVMAVLNSQDEAHEMVDQLKSILAHHEADLENLGIVPDYLAYMLVFHVLPRLRG